MPNPVLTEAIDRLASGSDLSADDAAVVLREVMAGDASEAQAAAFLIALRTKGETVDELIGLARTMRSLALSVEVGRDDLLDTAGTGGGRPTFNVSTCAAFVAAGAGCIVAKHGNRSATGRSGSADVLEALGARIDLEPQAVATCISEVGFGFMFAPHHHLAMRHVMAVRRELAVRTIFNFLGPLTNPAGATRQVIGVSDPRYIDTIAAALRGLGGTTALVVSSEDGLDEISVSGATRAVELRDGEIRNFSITPEELGVESYPADAVGAADPSASAAVARAVLGGAGSGAERSLVVVNAGAAVYVGGGAASLEEGVRAAEAAIDSGAALDAMERFVAHTQSVAAP
ncbi:MAG: anthranilate phosphoribosyltransferase [Thermoleophilaceae bacterium]|nr:anthranilate phosphoribosyltransferase [Thermoleophilaceae bacterium]